MRRLICVIFVFGFINSGWAERNPYYKDWLTPERLERWQKLSQNMTYHDLYTLIQEMYYLEEKPWSEPLKQILLKMTTAYEEMRQARLIGKPIIIPDLTGEVRGDLNAQLHEMVSWQNDPRFIVSQSNYLGQGLAARGLARIGEPAFEAIIKALEIPGSYAMETVQILMKNEDSFLNQDPAKQAIVQRALLKQIKTKRGQVHAIITLRYFPTQEVFTLLKTISETDPKMRNGTYHIRSIARESLEYLQNN